MPSTARCVQFCVACTRQCEKCAQSPPWDSFTCQCNLFTTRGGLPTCAEIDCRLLGMAALRRAVAPASVPLRGACSSSASLRVLPGSHPAAGWLPGLAAPDEFRLAWLGREETFFGRTPLTEVAAAVEGGHGTDAIMIVLVHPSGLPRGVAAGGDVAVDAAAVAAALGGSPSGSQSHGDAGEWASEPLTLAHTIGCRAALVVGGVPHLLNGGQPLQAGGASAGASLRHSYTLAAGGAGALLVAGWLLKTAVWGGEGERA